MLVQVEELHGCELLVAVFLDPPPPPPPHADYLMKPVYLDTGECQRVPVNGSSVSIVGREKRGEET